jgi:hypothetical protein
MDDFSDSSYSYIRGETLEDVQYSILTNSKNGWSGTYQNLIGISSTSVPDGYPNKEFDVIVNTIFNDETEDTAPIYGEYQYITEFAKNIKTLSAGVPQGFLFKSGFLSLGEQLNVQIYDLDCNLLNSNDNAFGGTITFNQRGFALITPKVDTDIYVQELDFTSYDSSYTYHLVLKKEATINLESFYENKYKYQNVIIFNPKGATIQNLGKEKIYSTSTSNYISPNEKEETTYDVLCYEFTTNQKKISLPDSYLSEPLWYN